MKKHLLLLTLLSLFAFTHTAWGQTSSNNEERLIRVEEGVKNLDRRFDDMNKRIDALETRMDKRFDELKNDLQGFCIGVLVFYLAVCLYLLDLFFGIEEPPLHRLLKRLKN